jgi:hypothetical protein
MGIVSESLQDFKRGISSKRALGIGEAELQRKWMKEIISSGWQNPTFNVNGNVINVQGDFFLHGIDQPPEYIKFGTIDGDFSCQYGNIKNLDWLPDHITGNLIFLKNGIQVKESDIEAICQVDGEIQLVDQWTLAQRKANKRYRQRGPRKDRKTHNLSHLPGGTYQRAGTMGEYSKGYKLWKAMELMDANEPEGTRYTDIINAIWNISHPGVERDKYSRGWGVGYFAQHDAPMKKYADKLPNGKWKLNSIGHAKLEEYRELFAGK